MTTTGHGTKLFADQKITDHKATAEPYKLFFNYISSRCPLDKKKHTV
jgi:hypothetical protein